MINREELIEQAIKEASKKTKEMIGKYNDLKNVMQIKTETTGSLTVDLALGGGIARGKITQIIGKTSSGKTTMALTIIKHVQERILKEENRQAQILYVDAENALNPNYARKLGVDFDSIILVQPSNGENGFEVAETLLDTGCLDLLIIDSIAAMVSKVILETEYGNDARIGAQARLIGSGMVKIAPKANKYGTTVVLLNQSKPFVSTNMYAQRGNSVYGGTYTPGGETLPFYCFMTMNLKRLGTVAEGDKIIANKIEMECVKNKMSAPYTKAEFYLKYGQGFDRDMEIITLSETYGFIEKTGHMYIVPEIMEKKINGRQNFIDYIKENRPIIDHLESKIMNLINQDGSLIEHIKLDNESEMESNGTIISDDEMI